MAEHPHEEGPAAADPPAVRILRAVASAFLACAVVLMTAQVVLRFGFNNPQAWAEEVDRYLFIWSVYFGALLALMRGTHIRVTFLVDALGPRARALSQWLTRLIGLGAFAFTAYFGFVLVWENRTAEFYTISGAPQVLFYLAAPVGLSLMSLVLLAEIVRDLRPKR